MIHRVSTNNERKEDQKKNEIILALVVAVAVIFFGALSSVGNERQRKAIDALREQVVFWAVQDLRIKRERLARDVRVDDPLLALRRKIEAYEVSVLNSNILFDLELPLVWKSLTQQETGAMERLWMYQLS